MRRRRVLQTALALPALPAAASAQASGASTAGVEGVPKLTTTAPDVPADALHRFFSREQFEALSKLCDAIVPATPSNVSAGDAGTAEFLDFLISQSPVTRQTLYRSGLDRLARDGVSENSLAPLKQPWIYDGPSDPFARFLAEAKQDILQAVFNSREQAELMAGSRRRGGGGGYYWRPLD